MTTAAADFDVLDGVTAGDRLKLGFTPEAMQNLSYLVALARGGHIGLSDGQLALLTAIEESQDWGGDQNRSMTITVGVEFDRESFFVRMHRALESLEVEYFSPAVDSTVFHCSSSPVLLRFKEDGFEGVAELLELAEIDLVDLGENHEEIEAAFAESVWPGGRRSFRVKPLFFLKELASAIEVFADVTPHLELLRAA